MSDSTATCPWPCCVVPGPHTHGMTTAGDDPLVIDAPPPVPIETLPVLLLTGDGWTCPLHPISRDNGLAKDARLCCRAYEVALELSDLITFDASSTGDILLIDAPKAGEDMSDMTPGIHPERERTWYSCDSEMVVTLHATADEAKSAALADLAHYHPGDDADLLNDDADALTWGDQARRGPAGRDGGRKVRHRWTTRHDPWRRSCRVCGRQERYAARVGPRLGGVLEFRLGDGAKWQAATGKRTGLCLGATP